MVGKTLGHYEILEPLGKGGMGEVYRARDTKLDRDVAIKVLPEDFATDPDRLARFEREAKLLASLNHANIASIYGLEDEGDQRFIVMEVVEGETLAERISRSGRIEVDEALEIARQIAEALEAAHENGVIHRDLKPANVIVTPEGKVKVLDFGLAKAYEADGSASEISPDLSHSPTMAAATRTGVIMGTAAYMSPEQARGKPVDKRADIWAFGCVVYEMLSGARAFAGETVSDTMAAILKEEPDGAALPNEISPRLRRLIGRCLDKDPRRRLRDIGDGRTEIENVLGADSAPALGAAPWTELEATAGVDAGSRLRRHLATALIVAAVGVLGFWLRGSTSPDNPTATRGVIRATIPLPEGHRQPRNMHAPLALSPDGTLLAYAARDETGVVYLFLREMDSGEVTQLPGTKHADNPFFSPNGQWLGFSSAGSLRKISIGGGAPQRLARVTGKGFGASWGLDDRIVFSPGLNSGLWRIDASAGGALEQLTAPDFAEKGYAHVWPQHLPGGRQVLFQMWDIAPMVLDLENLQWHVARDGGVGGDIYIPTGHIVHADGTGSGSLLAAAFDGQELVAKNTGLPVLTDVRYLASQSAHPFMAVSQNGTIVYVKNEIGVGELMWVDRKGAEVTIHTDEGIIAGINLSPDGTEAVYHDENGNLWTLDIVRAAPEMLLPGRPGYRHGLPLWNPDGRTVTFSSNAAGSWDLYEIDVGARSDPRPLLVRDKDQYPGQWSADGEVLVYVESDPETGFDVWVFPAGEEPIPVANSPNNEFAPVISPNGNLIAYVSDESGQHEVYVLSYPGGETKIASTGGGEEPRWSHDGSELFFTQGYRVLAATVTGGASLEVAAAQPLFEKAFERGGLRPYYDVAPDGRFLMVSDRPTTEFKLILNWFEELKRLVPTGGSR